MLITLATIHQLPQAFALGDSFLRHTTDVNSQPEPFLIGLIDDPAQLPPNFVSPYPIRPISTVLSAPLLATRSATYTPTEFAAACKPAFIIDVFRRYPDVSRLIYADPNVLFMHSLTSVWDQLAEANLLLTPHITQQPGNQARPGLAGPIQAGPDEKFFQNIGLYSADFLVFRRSAETKRLLTWWQDRVETRAYIDFCAGLCTDQLWLMHLPVFFQAIKTIKNPGWHVALWNLPERTLQTGGAGWQVTGPGHAQPLVFFNAKGLFNADEGFFFNQNRLRLANRPDVRALLATYRQAVALHANPTLAHVSPAYGEQAEPVVLRGWRRATVRSMRAITRFFDQIPLPAIS